MGILDALKTVATDALKTVAEEALKNAAGAASNTPAASTKAETLVGSNAPATKSTPTAVPPSNVAVSPSNMAASSSNVAVSVNAAAAAVKAAAALARSNDTDTTSTTTVVSSSNVAASVNVAAAAARAAAALAGSQVVTNELSRAEVVAIIEARVRAKGNPSNWQVSIVDLMTALDMNSSLSSRVVLAAKLNYSGSAADGSAEKNLWLHAELLKVLAKNGGKVPSYLL